MGLKTTGKKDDLLARIRGEVRMFSGRWAIRKTCPEFYLVSGGGGVLVECAVDVLFVTDDTIEWLTEFTSG